MKVLVSAASRHGATSEIAKELGNTLCDALGERGVGDGKKTVEILPVERVSSIDNYDAVVLGSAVYMGHWLDPARDLAERHADALSERPCWLFSSGPIGDPPRPEEEPVDVSPIMEASGARGHQVFAGKIDKGELGFAEKAVMLALRAPEGDFRDWGAIKTWARDIADVLQTKVSA